MVVDPSHTLPQQLGALQWNARGETVHLIYHSRPSSASFTLCPSPLPVCLPLTAKFKTPKVSAWTLGHNVEFRTMPH
jgi:hypothetical protein